MWLGNFMIPLFFGGSFFALVYFIIRSLSYEMPRLKVILATLSRDLRGGIKMFNMYRYIYSCILRDMTVGKVFQEVVRKHPDKPCFIFEGKEWTFQEVEEYSNQVANAFKKAGYKKGDEVALFMHNCPQYACIWLGLSNIGVICSLVNTNLKMQSLAHCINVVSVKALIFNDELEEAVRDVAPLLKSENCKFYRLGKKSDEENNGLHLTSLDAFIEEQPKKFDHDPNLGVKDKLFYIYTSGTTGLPKAAILRHSRIVLAGSSVKYVMGVNDSDIIYNTLPMYHSAGGMMYLALSLLFGNTTILRRKFSASNFWLEALKYRATVGIYIGEICRFLLSQPPSPVDKLHNIRSMLGNGLRPQIWREFQERFGITRIVEFYGATEGTANIMNFPGKPGAIGFISRTFSRVFPVNIIRVDPETGEPVRNKKGLCIRCKPGEPGVIVGKSSKRNPLLNFDGYVNSDETTKKIIKNCLEEGDSAFFSGDLVVMDEDGFIYFMDRTGDTFRWRGENVATNEVEMLISKHLKLSTCVVYGVQIPGTEGRAGMVAIQTNEKIDLDALYKHLKTSLPTYAVPIFIRICKQMEMTGTYKLKKTDLQSEGFDLKKTKDPIFFLDQTKNKYIELNSDIYNDIIEGKIRL